LAISASAVLTAGAAAAGAIMGHPAGELAAPGCATSGVSSRAAAGGAPAGTLSIDDLRLIERFAYMWRAPTCTHVTAIKAPGATVWGRFNADIRDSDTPGYLPHDMIVVRAVYDVPQHDLAESVPYGSPGTLEKVKSVILDAVTGRVLETSGSGSVTPDAHQPDPSALGTPTAVLAG
jgi:hypothetical protein